MSNLDRRIHLLLWAYQSGRHTDTGSEHNAQSAGICFSSGISQFAGLLASGWWFLHPFSSFLLGRIYCRSEKDVLQRDCQDRFHALDFPKPFLCSSP